MGIVLNSIHQPFVGDLTVFLDEGQILLVREGSALTGGSLRMSAVISL